MSDVIELSDDGGEEEDGDVDIFSGDDDGEEVQKRGADASSSESESEVEGQLRRKYTGRSGCDSRDANTDKTKWWLKKWPKYLSQGKESIWFMAA
jgi:hypothetical protein